MSSSISSLEQFQISSMYSESQSLFGTTSSNTIMQSMEEALSPSTLYNAATAATTANNTNIQSSTDQLNALVQFSSYANSLYQSANQLTGNSSNLNGGNSVNSDSINNFVNSYNNMINFANQNGEYLNTSVASDLANSYNNISSNLQSIGITQNSDGTLSMDQNTLNNALQNSPSTVQSAFNGFDGLAVTAGSIAQNITQSSLSSFANQPTSSTLSLGTTSFELYNNYAQLQQDNEWASLLNTFV
jgi:flagellar hook-associated protein 2